MPNVVTDEKSVEKYGGTQMLIAPPWNMIKSYLKLQYYHKYVK